MANNNVMTGLKRGVRRACPNCGEGGLFLGYLKVDPICNRCGHDNEVYRADDAAPYFTIFLVGHLVIAPMLMLGIIVTWPLAWVFGLIFPLITIVTLALLPFVKGAVIGVLWGLNDRPSITPVAGANNP